MSQEGQPYDAGDKSAVRKRKTSAKRKREAELSEMRWLLSHRSGRNIIWRILERAGVYQTSFAEPNLMAFKEGAREQGLYLLTEVFEADPDAYLTMMKENREKTDG